MNSLEIIVFNALLIETAGFKNVTEFEEFIKGLSHHSLAVWLKDIFPKVREFDLFRGEYNNEYIRADHKADALTNFVADFLHSTKDTGIYWSRKNNEFTFKIEQMRRFVFKEFYFSLTSTSETPESIGPWADEDERNIEYLEKKINEAKALVAEIEAFKEYFMNSRKIKQ